MTKTINLLGVSLVVVSFLLLIAFFATMGSGTGTIDSTAGEAMHVPLLTDTLFTWLYVLFAAIIIVTVAAALYQFVKKSLSNPKSALKSIIPILIFAGIFILSFFLGSGERMDIIGYEGTQNVGFWAQASDMFLYTVYTLLGLVILSIVGSKLYTMFK